MHPTWLLKAFFVFARPFVSAKFWRKLHYVHSLDAVRMSGCRSRLCRIDSTLLSIAFRVAGVRWRHSLDPCLSHQKSLPTMLPNKEATRPQCCDAVNYPGDTLRPDQRCLAAFSHRMCSVETGTLCFPSCCCTLRPMWCLCGSRWHRGFCAVTKVTLLHQVLCIIFGEALHASNRSVPCSWLQCFHPGES